jgi:hypothetical protein
MDRVLLVGGAMLLVGIALAGVFVIVSSYGMTLEMVEDRVVAVLDKL